MGQVQILMTRQFFKGVPDKKAHQLILQEYAEKRPGRLTARMLQKMTSLMSRSGTPASQLNPVQDRTPPVATPYLLTVILPTYREKMTMRLLRELKTLSYALDFLALGQGERASDILAQRMKALELVLSDQGWNRAQFLELIPPEGAGLVDPEEQRMASKEQALDAKLKSFLPAGWKKNDGGKGDEKGGKAGKKGKGLGKNDKSDWKKDGNPEGGAEGASSVKKLEDEEETMVELPEVEKESGSMVNVDLKRSEEKTGLPSEEEWRQSITKTVE